MVLEPFDLRGKVILADKGYDRGKFVRWNRRTGRNFCNPQPNYCKASQKYGLAHIQGAASCWKSIPQTQAPSPFCHQIREESTLFSRCCLPCLYPSLVAWRVLKQTLGCISTNFFSLPLFLSFISTPSLCCSFQSDWKEQQREFFFLHHRHKPSLKPLA